MKKYSKEQIIGEIISLLKYHSDDKTCLLFASLLMNKVNSNNEITLSLEEINNFLFEKDSTEINYVIFCSLSHLGADLTGVNFDGKVIKGYDFSNLSGVTINLDMVPDKNLSKTKFAGVTLKGTLDDAIIEYTDFTDYIGNIILDPQKVNNKSLKGSNLSGVTVIGNFDNVEITNVNFSGTKGYIRINPQKVPNKELIGINFSNVLLCGDENDKEFTEPSFDGCKIYDCKFKNTKGKIIINLDLIDNSIFPKLSGCDLTGVVIEGKAKSNYAPIHSVKEDGTVLFENDNDDLYDSYYFDEQGNYVHIYLYKSMMWDSKNGCWKYVSREKEYNLRFDVEFREKKLEEKQKSLTFFKKTLK